MNESIPVSVTAVVAISTLITDGFLAAVILSLIVSLHFQLPRDMTPHMRRRLAVVEWVTGLIFLVMFITFGLIGTFQAPPICRAFIWSEMSMMASSILAGIVFILALMLGMWVCSRRFYDDIQIFAHRLVMGS